MKAIVILFLSFTFMSFAFGCTKPQLYQQIDLAAMAVTELGKHIKNIKTQAHITADMKKTLEAVHGDMVKFSAKKKEIKTKVEKGQMTVDQGCEAAAKLIKQFADDMNKLMSIENQGK